MEFPNNSNVAKEKKQKPPKEKVEKVISGAVIIKKPPLSQKLKSIFLGGEFKRTANYVGMEVLLPAFRNLVVDSITKGVSRLVYGDSRAIRTMQNSNEYRPKINYNTPLIKQDPRERSAMLPNQPPVSNSERPVSGQIILSTKEEADLVIMALSDMLDKYDVVTVADLYDTLGHTTTHIDHKWGWDSIANVAIRQVREGFLMEFPPMQPIQ